MWLKRRKSSFFFLFLPSARLFISYRIWTELRLHSSSLSVCLLFPHSFNHSIWGTKCSVVSDCHGVPVLLLPLRRKKLVISNASVFYHFLWRTKLTPKVCGKPYDFFWANNSFLFQLSFFFSAFLFCFLFIVRMYFSDLARETLTAFVDRNPLRKILINERLMQSHSYSLTHFYSTAQYYELSSNWCGLLFSLDIANAHMPTLSRSPHRDIFDFVCFMRFYKYFSF